HLGGAAATALVVGLVEELFFRGYLLGVLGSGAAALVYALVHYVRPAPVGPAGGYDPTLGLRHLPGLFTPLGDARSLCLGVAGLFLFGLVLNALRRRTGGLYLGLGVHVGLVFGLSSYRRFLDGSATGDPWLFGGPRLYDGALGLVVLAAAWAAVRWSPLPAALTAPPPGAASSPRRPPPPATAPARRAAAP
ncbi:MAG: type II CAAX prenyl endopeptidase Rce1 family protein, partial [Planctomycetota bacterium]